MICTEKMQNLLTCQKSNLPRRHQRQRRPKRALQPDWSSSLCRRPGSTPIWSCLRLLTDRSPILRISWRSWWEGQCGSGYSQWSLLEEWRARCRRPRAGCSLSTLVAVDLTDFLASDTRIWLPLPGIRKKNKFITLDVVKKLIYVIKYLINALDNYNECINLQTYKKNETFLGTWKLVARFVNELMDFRT